MAESHGYFFNPALFDPNATPGLYDGMPPTEDELQLLMHGVVDPEADTLPDECSSGPSVEEILGGIESMRKRWVNPSAPLCRDSA